MTPARRPASDHTESLSLVPRLPVAGSNLSEQPHRARCHTDQQPHKSQAADDPPPDVEPHVGHGDPGQLDHEPDRPPEQRADSPNPESDEAALSCSRNKVATPDPLRHKPIVRQISRAVGLFVVAVAMLVASAACASEKQPSTRVGGGTNSAGTNDDGIQLVPPGGLGTPRGPLPDPRSVDDGDPGEVGDAVAIATYTADTRTDTSPMDGLRRARRWLTDDYANAVTQPIPGGGGADWIALADADGYTTATLTASDETRGGRRTQTSAVLTRITTITRHGRGGEELGTETVGTFITLTRTGTGTPWRVEQITTG